MPKFHVYDRVTGSTYLGVVEAKDEAEAIELVSPVACVSFCHQCTESCEDPEVEVVSAEPADDSEAVTIVTS